MKKIVNPFANIPANPKSHTLGWSQVWANHLDSEICHKMRDMASIPDTLYIDLGPNYSGGLNLFGGLSEEIFNNLNIIMSHPDVVILDHDMPDFGNLIEKRIGATSTYCQVTPEWCAELSEACKRIPSLKQQDLPHRRIIIGDSHSLAFSIPGERVLKNDGATLYGMLQSDFTPWFRGINLDTVSELTLSFGSIDIRHHLMRPDSVSLSDILVKYVKRIQQLESTLGIPVTACAPVPIEFEGRRLPKTGYYKGTPFFGTLEQRKELTNRFIELLSYNDIKMRMPPLEWYSMNPEEYAKTHMEFGSSVHIAPTHYARNNWGKNDVLI
jgi:hypothetical protein